MIINLSNLTIIVLQVILLSAREYVITDFEDGNSKSSLDSPSRNSEGSGYEGSGYEGSGYEGSGYEGSGFDSPTEGSGFDTPTEGSGFDTPTEGSGFDFTPSLSPSEGSGYDSPTFSPSSPITPSIIEDVSGPTAGILEKCDAHPIANETEVKITISYIREMSEILYGNLMSENGSSGNCMDLFLVRMMRSLQLSEETLKDASLFLKAGQLEEQNKKQIAEKIKHSFKNSFHEESCNDSNCVVSYFCDSVWDGEILGEFYTDVSKNTLRQRCYEESWRFDEFISDPSGLDGYCEFWNVPLGVCK